MDSGVGDAFMSFLTARAWAVILAILPTWKTEDDMGRLAYVYRPFGSCGHALHERYRKRSSFDVSGSGGIE